ncbi:MAG: hypothetical protein F4Y45_18310 [Acidobacteria bacterium]|nr:hypothetical protein [Acidobacteriota bacterium]MXZ73288.1 hypothetical protein [Acidobacteriota bacterium]MYD72650.1 hypothetical protein [Acidobacteriota bacterium]MYJ03044.1 hypothetical protein [Acidobacteriota bacterium]
MQRCISASSAAAFALLLGLPGCAAEVEPPPFRPTATVEELMRTMIDPAADAVWDAVVVDATPDGIIEIVPESEGDWIRLRRQAVTLAESANLLLVEGRRIAAPTSRSELPGIDLHPDAIQTLVDEDWQTWVEVSQEFTAASLTVLEAVDARDVDALLNAGTELDLACEACHAVYWYPGFSDPRPADDTQD